MAALNLIGLVDTPRAYMGSTELTVHSKTRACRRPVSGVLSVSAPLCQFMSAYVVNGCQLTLHSKTSPSRLHVLAML